MFKMMLELRPTGETLLARNDPLGVAQEETMVGCEVREMDTNAGKRIGVSGACSFEQRPGLLAIELQGGHSGRRGNG